MSRQGDRMERAGSYVLGLMDDGRTASAPSATSRSIRRFATRWSRSPSGMHVFDRIAGAGQGAGQTAGSGSRSCIAEMPQMRAAKPPRNRPEPSAVPEAPVTFGRRRSDARRETIRAGSRAEVTRIRRCIRCRTVRSGDALPAGADRGFRAGLCCGRFRLVADQPPSHRRGALDASADCRNTDSPKKKPPGFRPAASFSVR